jgi:hypothetical protein
MFRFRLLPAFCAVFLSLAAFAQTAPVDLPLTAAERARAKVLVGEVPESRGAYVEMLEEELNHLSMGMLDLIDDREDPKEIGAQYRRLEEESEKRRTAVSNELQAIREGLRVPARKLSPAIQVLRTYAGDPGDISQYWTVYLRQGHVLIPGVAPAVNGMWYETGAIADIAWSKRAEVRAELSRRLLQRSRPAGVIAFSPETPEDAASVAKTAGAASWSHFYDGLVQLRIDLSSAGYRVVPMRRDGNGWVPDRDRMVTLPIATPADEIAGRAVAMLERLQK